jgi:hypothetical protein
VRSARHLEIEVQGASLVRHRSDVRSFYDEDELRRVGYPEAAELIRSVTGAADVVVFDHNVRGRAELSKSLIAGGVKPPVFHIHTDFTEHSARIRAAGVRGALLTSQRMAAINVWRPIAAPLRDCPLAICDASSVEPRDLLATDLLYPDRRGQINYLSFNPVHRWFYASDMQADEVWIFKNYDSATDGRARSTPHTAFLDPTPHASVAPRESVEFRAFAVFDA